MKRTPINAPVPGDILTLDGVTHTVTAVKRCRKTVRHPQDRVSHTAKYPDGDEIHAEWPQHDWERMMDKATITTKGRGGR